MWVGDLMPVIQLGLLVLRSRFQPFICWIDFRKHRIINVKMDLHWIISQHSDGTASWNLNSFLVEDRDLFILHGQYQDCWGSADTRCQAISNQGYLTHFGLGDFNEILDEHFSSQLQWLMAEIAAVKLPLEECHQTLLMISQRWLR